MDVSNLPGFPRVAGAVASTQYLLATKKVGVSGGVARVAQTAACTPLRAHRAMGKPIPFTTGRALPVALYVHPYTLSMRPPTSLTGGPVSHTLAQPLLLGARIPKPHSRVAAPGLQS
jgi:hypothetical protein